MNSFVSYVFKSEAIEQILTINHNDLSFFINNRVKQEEHSSKIGGFHETKSRHQNHHGNVHQEFLSLCCWESAMEMKHKKNPITKFTSNSDEAFALLVLENGWDKWIKIDAHEHFISKHGLHEENTCKIVGVDATLWRQKAQFDLVDGKKRVC